MLKDNLYKNARGKLMSGILKCRDAVGQTMGQAGWNSIIEAIERPGFMVVNDGFQILSSIRFEDPLEELGRKMLLEAVSRANKINGDASSTTTVITSKILEEGEKYLKEVSPLELKRSLEECIPIIEESIKKQSREITVDNVKDVCSISAQDESIGAMIQEIYKQIGKDGLIHWDLSKTSEDSYTIGQGINIEGAKLASPHMADRDKVSAELSQSVVLKNPKILLTKEKILSAGVFENLFPELDKQGIKEIVVFCDEFDVVAIAQLLATQVARGFRTVVVKMPLFWKDQWYEDLALATGATVIDPVLGFKLKDTKFDQLGTVTDIVVGRDDTFIDGIKDLTQHVIKLQTGEDDDKIRAARLNTRTARLFIGAYSESALSYKRFKVEDAISAGWQALHGGIVAGGGVALEQVFSNREVKTIGEKILQVALRAPILQIVENAGITPSSDNFISVQNWGYDTRTKKLVDMFEAGIVDSASIIINSVKNAISVAATALTADTVVLLPQPEPQMVDPRLMMR